jgi:hypothetical protein
MKELFIILLILTLSAEIASADMDVFSVGTVTGVYSDWVMIAVDGEQFDIPVESVKQMTVGAEVLMLFVMRFDEFSELSLVESRIVRVLKKNKSWFVWRY